MTDTAAPSPDTPQVELAGVAQHPKGFWVATFIIDGERVEASNAFGSWQVPADPADAHDDDSKVRRQLLSPYDKQAAKALRDQLARDAQQQAA